ncbi:MAG TPA: hypothetical protein VND15_04640 [Candidatus Acidoferrales bacterium]|nr:hypothetical protein [Candidatus Acidoferrales bacterium]
MGHKKMKGGDRGTNADSGTSAFERMVTEAKGVSEDQRMGWSFIDRQANSLLVEYKGKVIAVLKDKVVVSGAAEYVSNFLKIQYEQKPRMAKAIIVGPVERLVEDAIKKSALNGDGARVITQSSPPEKFLKQ